MAAAVSDFVGAFLADGEGTSTIRKGMIDRELLDDSPKPMVCGIL